MDQNYQTQKPDSGLSPRRNGKKRPVLFLVVALAAIIIGTFIYLQNKDRSKHTAATPAVNTFYTATYKNKPVLFFRNKSMHVSGVPADPYKGIAIRYEYATNAKHHGGDVADFREVKNPKKLFVYDSFATIENFKLSSDSTYMSISFSGGPKDSTNYLYQTNLKTGESMKIWEHELGEGTAPYNSGTAYITEFIPNEYIVFAFLQGEPPPVGQPKGVVIKNIKSGAENVLGIVGDININPSAKTVSFKAIDKVQAPCNKVKKDPQCFATDTYKMVYQPTGETFSKPLP